MAEEKVDKPEKKKAPAKKKVVVETPAEVVGGLIIRLEADALAEKVVNKNRRAAVNSLKAAAIQLGNI